MTRRTALATLLLLAIAIPAAAKGVDGVTLTAGDQEVVIDWSHVYGTDGDLDSLVRGTYLYDIDWINGESDPEPVGDLGPVVIAAWNFPHPVGAALVQELYPFADGGPVGHIEGGQAYYGEMTTADIWHPLRPEITEMLSEAGLDLDRLETSGTNTAVLVGGIVLALSAIIAGRLRQVA